MLYSAFVSFSQEKKSYTLDEINVRDPFILPVYKEKTYYLYRSATHLDSEGVPRGGVEAFTSTDLKYWNGPFKVMTVDKDNWSTGDIWAPEVHYYKGKYYLFATLTDTERWKASTPGWIIFIEEHKYSARIHLMVRLSHSRIFHRHL